MESQRRKRRRTNRHSPFQALEAKLYRKFQEIRSKDRKVSSTWITASEKKIFVELQEKEPDEWETKEFKVSHGCLVRSVVRKQIKFKKRKCGKEKSAQESIPKFLKHFSFVRFDFLQPILED